MKKTLSSLLLFAFIFSIFFVTLPTTQAAVAQVDPATDVSAQDIDIELGSDGFARFAYFRGTTLYFAKCTNTACSSPVINSIGTAAGTNLDMVLGADNIARIAYQDFGNGFKFALCNDTSCSSPTITTPENNFRDGGSLVIALGNGADTFPRIAHADPFGSNLKFIQCLNASCSSTSKSALNLAPLDGFGPTIGLAIDATDHLPRIVFSDSWSSSVKYMECTSANCSTYTTQTLSGISTGIPSLQLSNTGIPKILINHTGAGTIEYINCSNTSCSSKTVTTVVSSDAYSDFSNSSYKLSSTNIPRFVYKGNSGPVNYVICSDASCSSTSTHLLGSALHIPVIALSSTDIPSFGYIDSNTLYFDYCTNAECSVPIFGTASMSTQTLSATNVQYTFSIDPGVAIPSGGKVEVSLPSAYNSSLASLTDDDISVTGTNITSSTETVTPSLNRITSTITSSAPVSDTITLTIGDGASGGLNDMSNPALGGSYSVALKTYDNSNTLLEQTLLQIEVTNALPINATVTEALILTLNNSSIALRVDPSVNNGEDKSQYTILTTATNALNGYSIYGKLDNGNGEARLGTGTNYIGSGTGENNFGFEALNAAYASNHTVTPDASFASTSTTLNSNSATVGFANATNTQQHTVYYDLNIDYTTPAGTYNGTITYTAIGSF